MRIPFIVHRQNLIKNLSHLFFIFFLFAILSCDNGIDSSGNGHDTSDSGSYTFSVNWPADVPTVETSNFDILQIDCIASNVETITARFYAGGNNYLTESSWSCASHAGTVYGIPAGTNRRIVLTGEDAGGNVLYFGLAGNITINPNQTTQGGEIQMVRAWTMLELPDTGVITCYTDVGIIDPCPGFGDPYYGQDANYTINPPSYTDNGNGTVTDNVTGLMWQQEDDNTTPIWDDAESYCNNLTLAGYTDWRLPSKMGLMSIVDYEDDDPTIDLTYFPGTDSSGYWSCYTSASNSSNAWAVDFRLGSVYYIDKSDVTNYVRCVRGGQ